MKIMYRNYRANSYEEISKKELLYRTSQEYYAKMTQEHHLGVFLIILVGIIENKWYFEEVDKKMTDDELKGYVDFYLDVLLPSIDESEVEDVKD